MRDHFLTNLINIYAINTSDYLDLFRLGAVSSEESRNAARKLADDSLEKVHKYIEENFERKV